MRSLVPYAMALAFTFSVSAQQGLKCTNGVAGHLEVPYAPATVPTTGLTLEAWITYNDATLISGYVWPTVARANQSPAQECYFLRVDASNNSTRSLRFKVWLASNVQLSTVYPFNPGQLLTWTHVAGTYDGQYARLYVNGVQVDISQQASGPIRDTNGPLRLGKGDDAGAVGAESWNGEIDEVRLWPFARSAGEIASTMNTELASLPGRVSTWNLNGSPTDSSGALSANSVGTVTFAANSLSLKKVVAAGGVAFGGSTSTCTALIDTSVTAVPQVGNSAFGLAGYKGPLNGAGALLLSAKGLTSALTVLSAAIWVDPTAGLVSIPLPTDGLGVCKLNLAIPNNPLLGNGSLSTQFVFVDSTCGPKGITASKALAFSILP